MPIVTPLTTNSVPQYRPGGYFDPERCGQAFVHPRESCQHLSPRVPTIPNREVVNARQPPESRPTLDASRIHADDVIQLSRVMILVGGVVLYRLPRL